MPEKNIISSNNLKRLFQPKSIAIYGGVWSNYVEEQCRKLGFPGQIWRVHPERENCFSSTQDLPSAPDSVFLGINRQLTIQEIKILREQGAGGAVVFASGFTEEEDGKDFSSQLENAAEDLPFIGPNCYGFVNFFDQVSLWPDQVTGQPVEQGIAFIAQSGTISITVMGQRRSLPIGYVITLGNQQRLAAEDLIRFCAEDERVTAIGMYLEGIHDLKAFIEAVDFAKSKGKPIALIKAGRSEKGRAVAQTHTGSLTGSDQLHDSLFERLGIARCENLSELVETLKLLHCYGPLPSNRILIFGASGGDMVMASDTARNYQVELSPIPDEQIPALQKTVGERVKLLNPLDIQTATWFDDEKMTAMFQTLFRCDYAITAFMVDPQDEEVADTHAFDSAIDSMLHALEKTPARAALLSSLPESLSRRTREKCLQAGAVPIQGLKESLEAVHHANKIDQTWKSWSLPSPLIPEKTDQSIRNLDEFESKQLLAEHHFQIPKSQLLSANDASTVASEIGFPVVIKAVSAELTHKTEMGGVALNLENEAQVSEAVAKLSQLSETLLVEEMIVDGVAEMILGIDLDPQFGLSLTLGAGGIFTELFQDSISFLLPLSQEQISEALKSLKIYKVLAGWRGKPAGDLDALVQSVFQFAQFAETHVEKLVACDINPLVVRPCGKGVTVLDALIFMKG